MSDDRRSGTMVAAINCVLNQNARADGAATCPGMNGAVLDVLRKHGVGVIQMPCPEMVCLGVGRAGKAGASIRDALDTAVGQSRCGELAVSLVDTIEAFLHDGYTVAAVLGGDVRSPGCAVPFPLDLDSREERAGDWGVFMRALVDELHGRGIEIPIRGIRDSAEDTLREDVDWLDRVLAGDA